MTQRTYNARMPTPSRYETRYSGRGSHCPYCGSYKCPRCGVYATRSWSYTTSPRPKTTEERKKIRWRYHCECLHCCWDWDVTPLEGDDLMPAGKHKGKKLKDVPLSYLTWVHKRRIALYWHPLVRNYIKDKLENK